MSSANRQAEDERAESPWRCDFEIHFQAGINFVNSFKTYVFKTESNASIIIPPEICGRQSFGMK